MNPRSSAVLLFLSLQIARSVNLFAAGIPCEELLQSGEEIRQKAIIASEIENSPALINALEKSREVTQELFDGYLKQRQTTVSIEEFLLTADLVNNFQPFIESKTFSAALSDTFYSLGFKDALQVKAALLNLKNASVASRFQFSELVFNRMDERMQQLNEFLDKGNVAEIKNQLKLDVQAFLELSERWDHITLTGASQFKMRVLFYLQEIEKKELTEGFQMARLSSAKSLTESEMALQFKLKKNISDEDLAQNLNGVYTDREFTRRIRLLKVKGNLSRFLSTVRYPKPWVFVVGLSVVPTMIVHGLSHGYDNTNIVATLIGGIATCPSLIDSLLRNDKENTLAKGFWWINALTLGQLNDLLAFINSNPKTAEELSLTVRKDQITERRDHLRGLRNQLLKSD